jgi:hypothetical protein
LKVVVRMESAPGEMMAAPTPCSARERMSISSVWARPHNAEPTMKTTRPIMNTRRRPNRSAIRPPSSSRPPKVSV